MKCFLCEQDREEGAWTAVRWLCAECLARPRHRYYYLNRPPCYGCQPEGFIDREAWMPSKKLPEGGHWARGQWAFGWVDYAEPLTPKQIHDYELLAADAEEDERYRAWLFGRPE